MKRLSIVVLSLMLAIILTACGSSADSSQGADCPDCPECPEIECSAPAGGEVPFEAAWAGSGHADSAAEAFRHWDEDGAVRNS